MRFRLGTMMVDANKVDTDIEDATVMETADIVDPVSVE